jgi:hypothetical protein
MDMEEVDEIRESIQERAYKGERESAQEKSTRYKV